MLVFSRIYCIVGQTANMIGRQNIFLGFSVLCLDYFYNLGISFGNDLNVEKNSLIQGWTVFPEGQYWAIYYSKLGLLSGHCMLAASTIQFFKNSPSQKGLLFRTLV